MDFGAIPVIKLEVESMRHAILHHMGLAGSELGEHLSAEIQRAVNEYPWKERVDATVRQALDEAIDGFFRYGRGRQAINKAIDDALEHLNKG